MRTRFISAAVSGAAVLAMLMTAPTASATPSTADAFSSALTEAVASSGVFDRGTTVTVREAGTRDGPGTSEPFRRAQTVNPDGSLTLRNTDLDGVNEVRCTRVDMCWQRVTDKNRDREWHPMPEGAIYYTSTKPDVLTFAPADLRDDATLDITDVAGEGRVFTYTYPAGEATGTFRWTVSAGRYLLRWYSTRPDGTVDPLASLTYTSQPKRIPVAAPPEDLIGLPTTAFEGLDGPYFNPYFDVNINR